MKTKTSSKTVSKSLRMALFAVAGLGLVEGANAEALAYVGLELVPMTFDVSSNKRIRYSQTIQTAPDTPAAGDSTTTIETTDHQMLGGTVSYAPLTLRGRLGLTILPDFFPVISLESHLGFDISQDKQSVDYTEFVETSVRVDVGGATGTPVVTNATNTRSINTAVELDNYIGIYTKASFPFLDNKANAHILLGWASAQFSGVARYGLPDDDTESGISYSFGGGYELPWWGLKGFAEYTQIINSKHYNVRGFGIGVTRNIK